MIFPRNSIGSPAMMGVSGTEIPFSFGGVLVNRTGGGAVAAGSAATGALGAAVTTGRGAGAGGESIFRRMPRSKPANFDLTVLDMMFVFELA